METGLKDPGKGWFKVKNRITLGSVFEGLCEQGLVLGYDLGEGLDCRIVGINNSKKSLYLTRGNSEVSKDLTWATIKRPLVSIRITDAFNVPD